MQKTTLSTVVLMMNLRRINQNLPKSKLCKGKNQIQNNLTMTRHHTQSKKVQAKTSSNKLRLYHLSAIKYSPSLTQEVVMVWLKVF
jgi:hypothetical protein